MLIEFRVQNHRSIGQEQSMTMEAMKRLGDDDDPRPRTVKGHDKPLLPVAAFYGANASGKSNFLAAMGFMRDAVEHSFRTWSPDEGIEREPFAWGPLRREPSLYEITMLIDGVRYQYGFELNDERILEEWLFAWPNGHKQEWFTRESDAFNYNNLTGENKAIESLTNPNSLFLSTSGQVRHPQLKPVYDWLIHLHIQPNSPSGLTTWRQNLPNRIQLLNLFQEETESRPLFGTNKMNSVYKNQIKELIEKADVGISNIRTVIIEKDLGQSSRKLKTFEFKHDPEIDDSWLDIKNESSGTITLFNISLPILKALQNGGVVVIDELEANLHPSLALCIVQIFNSPNQNPKNAQLLFTTHDTNLLANNIDGAALRRDQVWLTEKKRDGTSTIYPLTDFKPRKEENLERGYLLGRYGAVPFLGEFQSMVEEFEDEPSGEDEERPAQ